MAQGIEHKPTKRSREQVMVMRGALGIAEEAIALVMGCTAKTLRKHYRAELDHGMTMANTAVAGNFFRMACGSGPHAYKAASFWLKTQAQWSEFSPPPAPPKPAEPGKKDQAQAAAEHAGEQTPWGSLVH